MDSKEAIKAILGKYAPHGKSQRSDNSAKNISSEFDDIVLPKRFSDECLAMLLLIDGIETKIDNLGDLCVAYIGRIFAFVDCDDKKIHITPPKEITEHLL